MTSLTLADVVPGKNLRKAEKAPVRRDGINRERLEKLAFALGCVKVGIGLGEMLVPRAMSNVIRRPRRPLLMRLTGLRDLASGVGILRQTQIAERRPEVGALMGIAATVAASAARRAARKRAGITIATVAGVAAAGIVIARLRAPAAVRERTLRFSASTTINLPPRTCYQQWRDIERLPAFFRNLKSVRIVGERTSHWIMSTPGGKDIAWDAEITEDIPGEQISWRTVGEAPLPHSGSVRFEPVRGGQGTIVRLRMAYELPSRAGRAMAAAVLGRDPGFELRKDLLRFKSLMEAGEIPTTEGQPSGRALGATQLDRLARI